MIRQRGQSRLILCPSCGQQMYRYAPHCISCGYPLATYQEQHSSQRRPGVVGTLLCVLSLCICAFASIGNFSSSATNTVVMVAIVTFVIGGIISVLYQSPPRRNF